MNNSVTPKFWGIVPAAGAGKRMGASIPKQYLSIRGKPVLAHTLERLLAVIEIEQLIVALSPEDEYWETLALTAHPRIRRVNGGKERADSVLSALQYLSGFATADDWVLVHDAARLCITVSDVRRLIEQMRHHPVGGILAAPSSDTLKEVSGSDILATADRSRIWRAQTPQMFRLHALKNALEQAACSGMAVTDEASALELQGLQPAIVEGRADNIKITRPEDLALAAFYLEQQCSE
ncbi:2-C-methyl-D-erythritol 4-phosphate cytidylyltransferase [Candidatus Methylospira mobilis]|uniref:2-C-methyl-D-erythritol 4-phosphate cytidylyltransferase n=2 Tax=Candidatus Methylospira mobilis TaxID=1808979 RepID=A0A5Q0BQR9_9GAMM|nr:2-C-methyl-D-erythritol 4-phosphate cytidylyltransferase [Candidatus Methylospira mobilis]QFY44036.1 2-C-methyl-D-erythritol 4-phosphate cytidylyltransferase [Candidatus Methylospira mobilis]WNV05040.1 2-C-methyl-D-erythritol 4-phosphate cytidylyltransferase [Candidatus Methylospira mobilis]